MAYSCTIPFHYYRDFRDHKKCYVAIKRNITSLDLINELFKTAKDDFPQLEMSQVCFISTKDNDPFVVGITFEAPGEIPEKYQVIKFSIKILY